MCNPLKFFVKRVFLMIICVVNTLIALGGVACIILGLMVLSNSKKFNLIFISYYSGAFAGSLLILLGFILVGLGIIGNISACCGCNVLLYAYGVLLTIFILFQMVACSAGLSKTIYYDNPIADSLLDWYQVALKSYKTNLNIETQIDTLHTTFKCCGGDRPSDFMDLIDMDIPKSCCKPPHKNCKLTDQGTYYSSCGEKFKVFIYSIRKFFGFMIFLSILEILFLALLGAFICKFL